MPGVLVLVVFLYHLYESVPYRRGDVIEALARSAGIRIAVVDILYYQKTGVPSHIFFHRILVSPEIGVFENPVYHRKENYAETLGHLSRILVSGKLFAKLIRFYVVRLPFHIFLQLPSSVFSNFTRCGYR